MMKVVNVGAKDLALLQELDFRTYFFPLSKASWAHALVDTACVVYTVRLGNRSIGYMIVEPFEGNRLIVHRLGIHPKFRGLGAAKALLAQAEELCSATKSTGLVAMVPEYQCAPGDPDDLSLFLKWQGFKATGTKPGVYDHYGHHYDAIVFERRSSV